MHAVFSAFTFASINHVQQGRGAVRKGLTSILPAEKSKLLKTIKLHHFVQLSGQPRPANHLMLFFFSSAGLSKALTLWW